MKFLKKVIYYILIGFVGLVGILLLLSILPISGSIKFLVVQSGSMEPEIRMGDVVMIKPSDNYEIGDVICFGESSNMRTLITHRIHDIKVNAGDPVYTTKGDANNAPDREEVAQKNVIGKVLIDIPYIGYVVDFIKRPLGFALIIIVPAILIIFGEVKKIYEETRKKKTEED